MKKTKSKEDPKEEKKINIYSVKDIPGLGPVSAERLAEKGITNMVSLWAGMNNPIEIAKMEFQQGLIPISVKRPMPGTTKRNVAAKPFDQTKLE